MMISWIAVSLLTSSLAIAFAVTVQLVLMRRQSRPRANVPGVDWITKTLIDLVPSHLAPLFAAIVWTLVSVAASVRALLPRPSLFQLVVFANVAVLGPMLLGAYVYLVIALRFYEMRHRHPDKHREGDPKGKASTIGYQIAIACVSLGFQYAAIESEIAYPGTGNPWTSDGTLNAAGAVCYAVRGLDTYVALGLICVVLCTWSQIKRRFSGARLVEARYPYFRPTSAIRRVGGGLLLCVLLASVITLAEGASFYLLTRTTSSNNRIAVLISSTWVIWLALTALFTSISAAIVLWLRNEIAGHLGRLRRSMEERYESAALAEADAGTEIEEVKGRYEAIEQILKVRSQIADAFESAQTWPLPAGARATLGVAAAAQIINILGALYKLHPKL